MATLFFPTISEIWAQIFEYRYSLLKNILGASICWTFTHGTPCSPDYEPTARFSKNFYSYNYKAKGLKFWFLNTQLWK